MIELEATNIINFLTGLIILATVLLYLSNTTYRYSLAYSIQSIGLVGLTAFIAYYTEDPEIFIPAGITLITKVLIVPNIIRHVIKKINLVEEKEPFVNISMSLFIVGFLLILSYILIKPILNIANVITKNILPFAFAIVLIGFFMMATKKKANTQIFGLLILENGLYLATISTIYNFTFIIEVGIALDLLITARILCVFLFVINKNIKTIDTTMLNELKE